MLWIQRQVLILVGQARHPLSRLPGPQPESWQSVYMAHPDELGFISWGAGGGTEDLAMLSPSLLRLPQLT